MSNLIYRSPIVGNYCASIYETLPCIRMLASHEKCYQVALPYLYHVIYFKKTAEYRYLGFGRGLQIFCRNSPLTSLTDDLLYRFPLEHSGFVCTPHAQDNIRSLDQDKLCKRVLGIWWLVQQAGLKNYHSTYCLKNKKLKTVEEICQNRWEKRTIAVITDNNPCQVDYTMARHLSFMNTRMFKIPEFPLQSSDLGLK